MPFSFFGVDILKEFQLETAAMTVQKKKGVQAKGAVEHFTVINVHLSNNLSHALQLALQKPVQYTPLHTFPAC